MLLVLAAAKAPGADQAPKYTDGLVNCRGWRGFTSDMKTGWTVGVMEGFGEAAGAEADGQVQIQDFAGHALRTYGEREDGMEAFCAAPENALVPISMAVRAVSMKADGMSAGQWEEATAGLRRLAVQMAAKDAGK